ncbi:class I SAM-dependent methyltransferase [Ktedonosporobacter rubrisoli]|uniref:Class I SAM-dependent methyltransferase n=1 Tax=Ktedonosporobacter rubrisoli TaxID=2509675 RepID=A0A4P6K5H6_KTERU|nr:class I SAM-dependent methyltransferase [Ktedonosporobacter rubrisoli]QBD82796.1 class I SAM-dependent methyltransferase [Ktedonosporobacter rubrisoli]
MDKSIDQSNSGNTYVADPNDLKEMARLIQQDRALRSLTPPIFTDEEWNLFHRVLDIGCGPGGWVLDMAHLHPHSRFVGIDISEQMLGYARMLAQAESRENVEFLNMNATQPLAFPDASFDYVNGRFLYSFVTPQHWPLLLRECIRILRPNGRILVADYEAEYSTSTAVERLSAFLTKAGTLTGRSFSETGRSSGLCVVLQNLLRDAGFQQVEMKPYFIEFAPQNPGFKNWRDDFLLMSHTFSTFVASAGFTTQEEIRSLVDQALQDFNDAHFSAISLQVIAWGVKPQTQATTNAG